MGKRMGSEEQAVSELEKSLDVWGFNGSAKNKDGTYRDIFVKAIAFGFKKREQRDQELIHYLSKKLKKAGGNPSEILDLVERNVDAKYNQKINEKIETISKLIVMSIADHNTKKGTDKHQNELIDIMSAKLELITKGCDLETAKKIILTERFKKIVSDTDSKNIESGVEDVLLSYSKMKNIKNLLINDHLKMDDQDSADSAFIDAEQRVNTYKMIDSFGGVKEVVKILKEHHLNDLLKVLNEEEKYLNIFVADKQNNQYPLAYIAMGLGSLHVTMLKEITLQNVLNIKSAIMRKYKELGLEPVLGEKSSFVISVQLSKVMKDERFNLNDLVFIENNIEGIQEFNEFMRVKL